MFLSLTFYRFLKVTWIVSSTFIVGHFFSCPRGYMLELQWRQAHLTRRKWRRVGGRVREREREGAAEHQLASPLLTAVIRLPASHVTPTEAEAQSRPATAAAAAAAPCTLQAPCPAPHVVASEPPTPFADFSRSSGGFVKAQNGEMLTFFLHHLQSCVCVCRFIVGLFSTSIHGLFSPCSICLLATAFIRVSVALMFSPRSCGFPAVKLGNPSTACLLSAPICAANLLRVKFSNRAAPASTLD